MKYFTPSEGNPWPDKPQSTKDTGQTKETQEHGYLCLDALAGWGVGWRTSIRFCESGHANQCQGRLVVMRGTVGGEFADSI